MDQLTMDLAGRVHQFPGRLVDEDALRGLPLAQRSGKCQSGVAFLVGELVRLEELCTVTVGQSSRKVT